MSSRSKGTKRARSGDKTPESRSRRRLDYAAAAPLQGKSFFLHIQSATKARELEKKIIELGGVVEKFLSKELSCVVTDQPTTSARSTSQRKQTTNLALSGLSGSRAQAILQKSVKQQKQATKSTDVLSNAEKWGIQVKPVQQVLNWIDTQKKRQASAQPTGRVYNLRGAFLKVEDHSRKYKPLVKELNVWPRLNLDAPPGFSPFDEPISMRTRSRSSSKSPGRGGKGKTKQQPTGSTDKKGYCELCDAHYVGMEKHVASREHKLVASRKGTYAELDRLISRGKSLKEFEDEVRRKKAAAASKSTRVTRSRTRSRSPVAAKSTPKKNQKTPTKSSSSPRRTSPRSKPRTPSPSSRSTPSSRRTGPRRKPRTPSPSSRRTPSSRQTSPRRKPRTPSPSSQRTPSSRQTSPRRKPRTPSPSSRSTPSSIRTSPRRKPRTPSPSSRRTPSSSRKATQTVTPIKLVRFQDNQYSVVKSTSKKRRRNETDDANRSKSKRKKTDRYSIVESTPMRIRLRRSKRNTSSTARGSMFVNVPLNTKNPRGRSP